MFCDVHATAILFEFHGPYFKFILISNFMRVAFMTPNLLNTNLTIESKYASRYDSSFYFFSFNSVDGSSKAIISRDVGCLHCYQLRLLSYRYNNMDVHITLHV